MLKVLLFFLGVFAYVLAYRDIRSLPFPISCLCNALLFILIIYGIYFYNEVIKPTLDNEEKK